MKVRRNDKIPIKTGEVNMFFVVANLVSRTITLVSNSFNLVCVSVVDVLTIDFNSDISLRMF